MTHDGTAPDTELTAAEARTQRDQARAERDQARAERDQAQQERDQARRERDQLRDELAQAQREWGFLSRDSKRTNDALSTSNADLERLVSVLYEQERVKTLFYANMNHELRTPLSSIIGFSEDALDGLAGELNPEQRRYLANILHSSRHLLGVITELLDLARLQNGHTSFDVRPLAIAPLLNEAESMLSPMILKKAQSLTVEPSAGVPRVLGDADKVRQILLNLLSNAHKYTPRGGRLVMGAALEGDCVRVYVRDNGSGIAEADIPHLFEEFTRVAKRGRVNPPGTGLGLAITKHLVEALGGTIAVESAPQRGSTFSFTLPVAP